MHCQRLGLAVSQARLQHRKALLLGRPPRLHDADHLVPRLCWVHAAHDLSKRLRGARGGDRPCQANSGPEPRGVVQDAAGVAVFIHQGGPLGGDRGRGCHCHGCDGAPGDGVARRGQLLEALPVVPIGEMARATQDIHGVWAAAGRRRTSAAFATLAASAGKAKHDGPVPRSLHADGRDAVQMRQQARGY